MPRKRRTVLGGMVYHVLNRATARRTIFAEPADYEAFEKIMRQAHERVPMRTLAYCLMPNHWHLVLRPWHDGDLSAFMHWLTLTHTQRWQRAHDAVGAGHLYQGRFKSFPVQTDGHFLTVCRYVERNPFTAGLVGTAKDWAGSSLYQRMRPGAPMRDLLCDDWPVERPQDWLGWVDQPLTDKERASIQASLRRGRPFGTPKWVEKTAAALGLESALRPRGRPPKQPKKG